VDPKLDLEESKELWPVLEQFVEVSIWHKLELGCCYVGEHYIHTHGFPPYMTIFNHLYFWEESKVNKYIHALVFLSKMCPNHLEYTTCKVTLPIKKDRTKCFYGDYTPLNL
jgi:hypothetical protein